MFTKLLLVIGVLTAITPTNLDATEKYVDDLYPQTFMVRSYDAETSLVLGETSEGFLYEWYSWETDYEVGDMVSAIMDSNGTEDITDDIVVCDRYAGGF